MVYAVRNCYSFCNPNHWRSLFMHRRYLSAVILLLALVTGATGKLITTAFCARSSQCHEMPRAWDRSQSAVTHERHGMHMDEMPPEQTSAAEWQKADLFVEPITSFEAVFVEPAVDPCSHCVSHSNLPQSAPALHQADVFRSSGHVAEAEVSVKFLDVVLSLRPVRAREHAPPGTSSPLHVRINVFRI